MKLKRLSVLIAAYVVACPALAVEFNVHALNTQQAGNVDLSAFSQDGYVAPGNYLLDIYYNGSQIASQQMIRFMSSAAIDKNAGNHTGGNSTGQTTACITPDLAAKLDLKDDVLQRLKNASVNPQQCLNLISPDSKVSYDQANQRLTITTPQAWQEYQEAGWVPPARWDNGVAGVTFDYNLMYNRYMPENANSSSDLSLYGTLGLNAGAWRLRSDYQYYRNYNGYGRDESSFTLPQTWLFRPLPSLRSRLSIGQIYLNSQIFDSFRFTGVSMESDQRMLPPSLQGYAPQITGIAHTQAQVTVSQRGRIIYQTTVSPGPFVLPALNQLVQGNLDVSVRESDGSVRHWQVNTASVPLMVRRHQLNYKLSLGGTNYTGSNRPDGPLFVSAEAQWGAFNRTTLYGGLIVSGNQYQALAAGAGEDLGAFGALSADVTRSQASVRHGPRQSGYSFRINYAKTFNSIGSNISFIGYRFSQRNFMTLSRFLDLQHGVPAGVQEKQSFTLMYSQNLPFIDTNLSLSVSRLSYWNTHPSNNYQISVNKLLHTRPFNGASVSLTLARNQNGGLPAENQIYLSLSVPIGRGSDYGNYLGYSFSRNNHGGMDNTISYNGYTGNNLNWNLNASHDDNSDSVSRHSNSLSGNMQYQSRYGQVTVSAAMRDRDYRSIGLNWYGSATATAHGVAFHQSMTGTEPRMMIDTGVAGVPVDNGAAVTNGLGVAVVSAGGSYLPSDTYIDVSALPDNLSVKTSVISDVLTEGAIGYRRVTTERGGQLYGAIRLANGGTPPFGAQVVSLHSGRVAGMVGDGGVVLLTGLQPQDRDSLVVKRDGQTECHLSLPEKYSLNSGMLLLTCKP